jgi:hypothetical protein
MIILRFLLFLSDPESNKRFKCSNFQQINLTYYIQKLNSQSLIGDIAELWHEVVVQARQLYIGRRAGTTTLCQKSAISPSKGLRIWTLWTPHIQKATRDLNIYNETEECFLSQHGRKYGNKNI